MLQQHSAAAALSTSDRTLMSLLSKGNSRSMQTALARFRGHRRQNVVSVACRTSKPIQRTAVPKDLQADRWAALSFTGKATATVAALLLAGTAVFLQPALAKPGSLDLLSSCSTYKSASQGISYCDVRVGSGAEALAGDLIEIDYTARATTTVETLLLMTCAPGKVYDGSTKFRFTLGNEEVIPSWELGILGDGGQLPAMREGGLRTVRIPPKLAFGKEGDGCLYGLANSCRIPPNSPVEITTAYKGSVY